MHRAVGTVPSVQGLESELGLVTLFGFVGLFGGFFSASLPGIAFFSINQVGADNNHQCTQTAATSRASAQHDDAEIQIWQDSRGLEML